MAKKVSKNNTPASGYKAGGGSQAKAAKSPKNKGLSPAEIAMLAASFVPAGRIVTSTAKVAGKVVAKRVATKKAIDTRVKENIADRAKQLGPDGKDWVRHPGAASYKSHERLTKKNKWSSDKQIAKYQRQEAKAELKSEIKAKTKKSGKKK